MSMKGFWFMFALSLHCMRENMSESNFVSAPPAYIDDMISSLYGTIPDNSDQYALFGMDLVINTRADLTQEEGDAILLESSEPTAPDGENILNNWLETYISIHVQDRAYFPALIGAIVVSGANQLYVNVNARTNRGLMPIPGGARLVALILESCSERTLYDFLVESSAAPNSSPLAKRIEILKHVGRAIEALHRANRAHLDIQLTNVRQCNGNGSHSSFKLMGFDITQTLWPHEWLFSSIMVPSGSPHYLAPEFDGRWSYFLNKRDEFAFALMSMLVLTGDIDSGDQWFSKMESIYDSTTFSDKWRQCVEAKATLPTFQYNGELSDSEIKKVASLMKKLAHHALHCDPQQRWTVFKTNFEISQLTHDNTAKRRRAEVDGSEPFEDRKRAAI